VKTALIIDDDANYRKVLGKILKRNGWHILSAAEGDEGIELARAHRPEVVLCDLLMPRCNGFVVCRSLRSDDALRQTKIVIISGRNFESDRLAALEAGADEYLTKPVKPNQLVVLLSRLVGGVALAGSVQVALGRISPSPARLKFWGVRGSIPTPGPATVRYGGNTSCVEVRADEEIIILDAGTGLRPLGRELVAEFGDRPLELTLLLTHTHWDHIQGLPFFLPVYKPQSHLRILGYEGARHGLESVLSGQMESPFFPIGLRELPANVKIEELKELSFAVGKVRVAAFFSNHPGICVGYRLFTAEGSIAFFPDYEPRHAYRHLPPDGQDQQADSLNYALNEDRKMIDFLRGAEVLIMDAQYDRQEYQQHVGWGHACVDDVVALALRTEVKRLYLFHHDPEHDDAKIEQMVAGARKLVTAQKGKLHVEAAREGAVLELAARK